MSAPARAFGERTALRFAFLYTAFFALSNSALVRVPGLDHLLERYAKLWHPPVAAFGRYLLGIREDIPPGGGVSNSLYGLVYCLTASSVALLGALAWSALDRRGGSRERLAGWLRWLLRLVVASQLIHYGMIKLVPTQMIAPPPPAVLLFRLGELRPNFLLWWFMGASPAFESITGLAELLGGLLLLLPRTTLLGALLCTADMLTVVLLNFGYDVQVKVFSFHLMAFSALLLLPDLKRLADLFFRNRRVEAADPLPVSLRPSVERTAQGFLLALGLFFLVQDALYTHERYQKLYPPHSPFYAAWSVDSFVRDGSEIPLHTDPARWRWVTFGKPGGLYVERMDGGGEGYRAELDAGKRTLALARKEVPAGTLRVDRPDDDVLLLEGTLDGHGLKMRLTKMALLRRGFRGTRASGPGLPLQ